MGGLMEHVDSQRGPRLMRHALGRSLLQQVYDGLAGRYDLQHAVVTAGADGRGRRAIVIAAVRKGDRVLDAGGGTGSTALLAARAAGATGRVCVLDWSRGMLAAAERKLRAARVEGRVSFDIVLSTYSLCPLADPSSGAAAMYDLVRPGGRLGAAHSAEPAGWYVRWLATRVENLAWRMPWLSMGCRAVSVLPRLRALGAVVERDRRLGIPLWPFHVSVVRKPRIDGPSAA
jgi:ubiquinone/menaquinone biosynthesis C-methylase UbiE